MLTITPMLKNVDAGVEMAVGVLVETALDVGTSESSPSSGIHSAAVCVRKSTDRKAASRLHEMLYAGDIADEVETALAVGTKLLSPVVVTGMRLLPLALGVRATVALVVASVPYGITSPKLLSLELLAEANVVESVGSALISVYADDMLDSIELLAEAVYTGVNGMSEMSSSIAEGRHGSSALTPLMIAAAKHTVNGTCSCNAKARQAITSQAGAIDFLEVQ
jgi:hypothetical protein